MQISQTIHYSMAAPVRFYYSITTHTPAVLPVLIVYGLYTTSNPFEVIIQIILYTYHGRSRKYYCSVSLKKIDVETFRN